MTYQSTKPFIGGDVIGGVFEAEYLRDSRTVTTCFLKRIYCRESMYSMFKDKLQNCYLNQCQ